MLASLSILVSDLVEYFSNHPQAVDLFNVFDFSVNVLVSQSFDLHQFLVRILVVVHSATVCQGVVHGQLLLQIPYFFFKALDPEVRINNGVDHSLVFDLHHSC